MRFRFLSRNLNPERLIDLVLLVSTLLSWTVSRQVQLRYFQTVIMPGTTRKLDFYDVEKTAKVSAAKVVEDTCIEKELVGSKSRLLK